MLSINVGLVAGLGPNAQLTFGGRPGVGIMQRHRLRRPVGYPTGDTDPGLGLALARPGPDDGHSEYVYLNASGGADDATPTSS